jgi:predicted amidohydrolase YtcJ
MHGAMWRGRTLQTGRSGRSAWERRSYELTSSVGRISVPVVCFVAAPHAAERREPPWHMSPANRYLIRHAMVEGHERPVNVLVEGSRISALGEGLPASAVTTIDANGGRLLPGLIDHHIHLFAAAAAAQSICVSPELLSSPDAFEELIRKAARNHGSARVIGYLGDENELLDRWKLDEIAPDVPVRVQYRTGSLWVLNSAALDELRRGLSNLPSMFERDSKLRLTGRVWRGDAWLRSRDDIGPPSLRNLGRRLARWGVIGVTDASSTNDQAQAAALAAAIQRDGFPQSVMVMSSGQLRCHAPASFIVGPVKIMLDERALPRFDGLVTRIRTAHAWERPVAAHCVTTAELALMIAALDAAGSIPGDRIEHGSMIPLEAIPSLRELGVTIVTQPGFVQERGDQYLRDIPLNEQPDLYRCASLMSAGIKVAGSTDAPYSNANPWHAVAAAIERNTHTGASLNPSERLTRDAAIALFCGNFTDPGGEARSIRVGTTADLCMLHPDDSTNWADPVAATFIKGELVYRSVGAGTTPQRPAV